MTVTTHAAIGAALGVLVGNPILGFVLGAASHFLVDMIPHGDNVMLDHHYHGSKKQKQGALAYVGVDAGVAVLLVAILGEVLPENMTNLTYTATIAGSVLPDIILGISHLYKTKTLLTYQRFHFFFHDFFSRKHGDVRLGHALLSQALFIVVVIFWLT